MQVISGTVVLSPVLGLLTYEVTVDECTWQVHIENLLLCATSMDVKDATTSGESVDEPAEVE